MANDGLVYCTLSSAVFAAWQKDGRISPGVNCIHRTISLVHCNPAVEPMSEVGLLNLPVTEKADKAAPTLLIAQKKIGKMLMETNSDRLSAIIAFIEKWGSKTHISY